MVNKNILVLSPTPSHPQDAGNRKRIFALTKYLKELGANIYFVYCPREWDRDIPKDAFDGMNNCWDYFFVAYPVQPAVHRTDDEYFEIDAWWDVGIEFAINWIKLATEIDIVLCNYVFYSKVLELFDDSVTKIIDTHDIVSNRNYLLDRKLGYRDFFYVSPESEQKALNRAHLTLSIKEDEANWFKCLSETPVLTIGHLEPEPDDIAIRDIDYNNIKLGFIGSSNPINVRNLESFLEEYLLAYDKYKDKQTFIVGGKICDALSDHFRDKVEVIGKVKEVSEFYDLVDIVVLPFEFSTGLKIKTVEALSWSKPCIGTINAFEGLGSKCQYHSYETIEELATGVEKIVKNPCAILPKLQEDSKTVYTHYTNSVKKSIEKLYKVDWKSVKTLQKNSTLKPAASKTNRKKVRYQTKYHFNIITNVDFWNAQTNEELWLTLWIDNARNLGEVDVYRTKNFQNAETDKLELYKLGLVDYVHHRELYQILDLFQADFQQDKNQVCVNLVDFNSIIFDQACLRELEYLQLAENHCLFYFLSLMDINSNGQIKENVNDFLEYQDTNPDIFYLWDLVSDLDILSQRPSNSICLTENPIKSNQSNQSSSSFDNLEQIVIGTSCLDTNNQAELNKLIFCYQNFLPQHFQLVIFSDLELTTNSSITTCSLKNAADLIQNVDIFICVEEPETISYLLYLCICNNIPVYAKSRKFRNFDIVNPLENFASIPQAYQSFLEKNIVQAEVDSRLEHHASWQKFLEYWLNNHKTNVVNLANNYSLVS